MGTILEDQNISGDPSQHPKTFPTTKALPGLGPTAKYEDSWDTNNMYTMGLADKDSENWNLAQDAVNIRDNSGTEDDPLSLRPPHFAFRQEGERAETDPTETKE